MLDLSAKHLCSKILFLLYKCFVNALVYKSCFFGKAL